jgi:hypothetical protein
MAAASLLITVYGAGAFVGPLVASALIGGLGPNGYAWAVIGMHASIAVFLAYRLRAWRAPLVKAESWSDVSLPARLFFVPATVVAMSRRMRARRRAT